MPSASCPLTFTGIWWYAHTHAQTHTHTCTHSECNENPVVTRTSIIKYSSTLKPHSRNICYFIHRRMRHCNTSEARPEALITHFKAGCAEFKPRTTLSYNTQVRARAATPSLTLTVLMAIRASKLSTQLRTRSTGFPSSKPPLLEKESKLYFKNREDTKYISFALRVGGHTCRPSTWGWGRRPVTGSTVHRVWDPTSENNQRQTRIPRPI